MIFSLRLSNFGLCGFPERLGILSWHFSDKTGGRDGEDA